MVVAVLMVVLICLLTAWGVFGDRLLARRRADLPPPPVTPRPVTPTPVPPEPAPELVVPSPPEPQDEPPGEPQADEEPEPEPVPEPAPMPVKATPKVVVKRPAPKLPPKAWSHLSTPWERAAAMPIDEPDSATSED